MRWFGGVILTERAWLLTEAGSGESAIQSLQCSCALCAMTIYESLHEHNREQRAAEQADGAKQARLVRSWKANQQRRQVEGQPEPQQTIVPTLEEDWVQA